MTGARQQQLAYLVAEPWPSIEELLAGLRAIDDWGRERGDARGGFAAAYALVTAAVADALDHGSFADPEWVVRVVLDFADRYRLAVQAAVNGEPDRPCWGPALRPAGDGSGAAIVALVHAMIAHIHHDLAHTLSDCAPIHPLRATDYDHLGAVICGATRRIQRELLVAYAPALRGAHEVLRGADTWLTNTLVRAWRMRARLVAERMSASPPQAAAWSRRLARESAALAATLNALTWGLGRGRDASVHDTAPRLHGLLGRAQSYS
ncbi:MAG: hypothetical protein H0T76_01130 [Nannocystis sp.]|nr:DUF5995 family protein [Nannocystis sp.]MBA3545064.1 hypothetical protein [Nannocystis sp.]